MKRILGALCASVLLALSAHSSLARAQEDEYRAIVGEAVPLLEAERWAEAYALFRRAHELRPSARTLRGLGMAAVGLERFVEAIELLERSLSDARNPLTPDLRAGVERLLARARAVVARLRVVTSAPGAMARLDGEAFPLDAPMPLDPGEHRLVVQAPGHVDAARTIRLGVAADETVEVVLVPLPAAEPARAADPAPVAEPARVAEPTPVAEPATDQTAARASTRYAAEVPPAALERGEASAEGGDSTLMVLGGIALGVGIAGLGVGITAHAIGEDAIQDWNESVETRMTCQATPEQTPTTGGTDDAECFRLWNLWNDSRPIAIAGYVAGGVLSATGIVLLIVAGTSSGDDSSSTLTLGPGPGEVGLSGRVRF